MEIRGEGCTARVRGRKERQDHQNIREERVRVSSDGNILYGKCFPFNLKKEIKISLSRYNNNNKEKEKEKKCKSNKVGMNLE